MESTSVRRSGHTRSAGGTGRWAVLVAAAICVSGCSSTVAGQPSSDGNGSVTTPAPNATTPGAASPSADAAASSPSRQPGPGDDPAGETGEHSGAAPGTRSGESGESGGGATTPPSGESGGDAPTSTAAASSTGSESGGNRTSYTAEDLRSIDPCSFFDDATFADLGDKVHPALNYTDYTGCDLTITARGGKDVRTWSLNIDAGTLYADADELATVLPGQYSGMHAGGFDLIVGDTEDGRCLRAIQVPDVASVVITVHGDTDVCDPGDLALLAATKALNDHLLATVEWPSDSLVNADLCAEFASAAGRALGSDPKVTPKGLHACRFDAGESWILIYYGLSPWPPTGLTDSPRTGTIGGHRMITTTRVKKDSYVFLGALDFGRPQRIKSAVEGSLAVLNFAMTGPGDGQQQYGGFMQLVAAGAR